MTAQEFLSGVTEVIYLAIAAVVTLKALHRPNRASIDSAAFFGLIAFVLLAGDVLDLLGVPSDDPGRQLMTFAVVSALPYLLLRLVDDLAPQPRWVMILSPIALIAMIAADAMVSGPRPILLTSLLVAYFVALGGYDALQFIKGARLGSGVTARRMQAVAAAIALLAGALVVAIIGQLYPAAEEVLQLVTGVMVVASGLAFFIGFAPPSVLRRAWQEPELRAFLGRAAVLPRLPETSLILHELELGAASSLGAPSARIGLWEPDGRRLRYAELEGGWRDTRDDEFISGRSFTEQRPIFSANAIRDDPANAESYRRGNARAVMAAPITAGERRLGVLAVWAARAPIFADDDLRLVQLLADQAAVILESRALIDEAVSVRAREEQARLKDDFLSAAAHDLRTPLTTVLIQAELLLRSAARAPGDAAWAERVTKIVEEARRLRTLVNDLLDAGRAERGQLVAELVEVDLVPLAREVAQQHATPHHPCRVDARQPVIGTFDAVRIRQLLENLVGNGVKYSPDGGEIVIRLRAEGEEAILEVSDQGIGIPSADQPLLFSRFHRAANVDDRQFQGMGLGLYFCRAIVEAHGGRISVSSEVGTGTTFHVRLPLSQPQPAVTEPAQPAPEMVAASESTGG